MFFKLTQFAKNHSGATNIEYAIIAGAIGLSLAAAGPSLKSTVFSKFDTVSAAMTTNAPATKQGAAKKHDAAKSGALDATTCSGDCSGARF